MVITNINKANNHVKSLNIFGNPGSGLGQAHTGGRVKSINGISTQILMLHFEDLKSKNSIILLVFFSRDFITKEKQ
jgi:hypothetical protein